MKLGDRGSAVTEVQEFLIGVGFLTPILKRGEYVSPETNYGIQTKKAVMDLQKFLGLSQTGIWDESIYDVYSEKSLPMLLSDSKSSAEEGYYVVVRGDTLSGIAQRELGSASRWPEIYKLNKDIIKDPNLIYPGQKIKIPDITETKTVKSIITTTPDFQTDSCPKGRWFDRDKEIECYVINRLTGTKIVFGISPDEVTESNSAQFDDADIRGRSSPFKQYSQTGPRSVSFTIQLYADYCPMGIVQTVNAVKALVYPRYTDVIEAPHAYFKIGKFMALDGVVNSVSVSWRKPFRDGYYLFADVSIDMDEVRSVAQSVEEVESNG